MNQSEIADPIIDPTNNEEIHKNVFVIFAHGKNILAKIRKISESLGASLYGVDENSELRRDQIHEVNTRLGDVTNVLRNTKNTLDAELSQIARSLAAWMIIVKKEKAVYDTLNKFSYDQARKTLIAEAWCPTNSLALIKSTLQDVNDRAGLSVPTIVNQIQTNKTPPTYVRTNKFTEAFQTIVNSYGISKYSEVNPGIYTVVTFPFMFAVMFGDSGHGFLMTLTATALIFFEKKLTRTKLDEISSMFFYGRYIMLLMGLFSIYTGFIYNDIFSRPFTFLPSQWQWPEDITAGQSVEASLKGNYRFPIGLDWNWHGAENALLFSNSMKMKMSVLLGWCHMTFALCFQYINARHFKSKVDLWGNFVPSMLFFQSIFGYLALTIVYKWTVNWQESGDAPPSLLNMLIFMFLSPGNVTEHLYSGQATVQTILLLIAVAQVPIMLLLKPFWLRYEHNKARALGYRGLGEQSHFSALDEDGDANGGTRDSLASDGEGVAMLAQDVNEEHEEFEFGDVMIHQVIHTIEFCLNCISHTASYLRLWALSLAHQQLSIVLWNMTLGGSFESESPVMRVIMIVVTFYMWFVLSVRLSPLQFVSRLDTNTILPGHRFVRHGRNQCHASRSSSALGRSDEQTFHGRRCTILAIQLQDPSGGGPGRLILTWSCLHSYFFFFQASFALASLRDFSHSPGFIVSMYCKGLEYILLQNSGFLSNVIVELLFGTTRYNQYTSRILIYSAG